MSGSRPESTRNAEEYFKESRYAYMLKKNPKERFGLLMAVDYADARRHLGPKFYIRKILLTIDECHNQAFDRELRWDIVSKVFSDKKQVTE